MLRKNRYVALCTTELRSYSQLQLLAVHIRESITSQDSTDEHVNIETPNQYSISRCLDVSYQFLMLSTTHTQSHKQSYLCVVYALQALEAARADHEKFVSERQTRRDIRMSSNRTQEQVFLEQLEADLESDNPWERIVSLVDTQVCTR
jgi:Clathrin light chain